MADIKQVVDVQISVTNNEISTEDFSLLLILGYNKVFAEKYRVYSDTEGLLSDGFRETDPEYLAASAVFMQNPMVEKIYIGRRESDSVEIIVNTAKNDTDYHCKINNTTFTYTSDASATSIEIAAGLVALINAGTEPVTATAHLDGTYKLTVDVALTPFTVSLDSLQSIDEYDNSQTIVQDISDIQEVIDDWYAIMETGRIANDVLSLAAWCETNYKLFGTASSDTNIINQDSSTDTTSVVAQLRALKYRYTFCIFRKALDFIEAGLFGSQLALAAGKATWSLKSITGFASDNLTTTQSSNAISKQCNTYESIAGFDAIRTGMVFDSKFMYIDVVRDLDWLKQDIQVEEFRLLIDNPKIPYTDAGISMCQGVLRNRLDKSINMGILAEFPNPSITAPLAKNVSVQDKQDRILRNLNFTAILTGAIQSIKINGSVSF
jgi:hypothetical protein